MPVTAWHTGGEGTEGKEKLLWGVCTVVHELAQWWELHSLQLTLRGNSVWVSEGNSLWLEGANPVLLPPPQLPHLLLFQHIRKSFVCHQHHPSAKPFPFLLARPVSVLVGFWVGMY